MKCIMLLNKRIFIRIFILKVNPFQAFNLLVGVYECEVPCLNILSLSFDSESVRHFNE